jgi:hypothetical protein
MNQEENAKSIVNFEDAPVRRVWDEKSEKWFFAIVDIVAILTESVDAGAYWRKMKERLKNEGNETVTKRHTLKMRAADGKMREIDVADTESILRIIQSIPSPKAEPFKMWLAKVGYERLQETVNPEIAVNRARKHWLAAGRSAKWIEQRMRGQEIRNKLTDYWSESGVKEGIEYASLTDIIHQEWSGFTTGQHKKLKGLKQQNLRDNMTEAEIIFTSLAELSTRQIAETDKAKGYVENIVPARKGGRIAGNARRALEKQTGKKVVSGQNFLPKAREVKRLKN